MRRYLYSVLFLVTLGLSWAEGPASRQFDFAEGAFVHRDYLTAIEEFRTYLEEYPEGEQTATALLRLGQCYLRVGDHAKAAEQYEAFLKKHPLDERAPRAHFDVAQAYTQLNNQALALEHYQAAAGADDARVREEAIIGQGEALIALEKYPEAALLYEEFLKAFPQSTHRPAILFSRGWVLQQTGESATAVTVLEELVAKHEDFGDLDRARLLLSDAASAAGNHERAAEVLREVMAAGREAEAAMLRLAWTMYRGGDKNGAAALFIDFAHRYPTHDQAPTALYNAAISYYDSREFAKAAEICRELRQAYPDQAPAKEAHFWLGLSLLELQQHAAAAEVLEEVLNGGHLSAEQAPSALYGAATALAAAGKAEAAIGRYRQLREAHPQSGYYDTASYSLANLLAASGDRDAAVQVLTALLASHPQSELLPRIRFALGEHLFFLDRFGEALVHLEACREAGDDEAKVLCRLGWTQFRLEDHAGSQATFMALSGMDSPFRQEARYMAGRASEMGGNVEQAVTQYQTVIEAGDGPFVEKASYSLAFLLKGKSAIDAIRSYLTRFPEGEHVLDLRLKLAELRLAAGEVESAREIYAALAKAELSPVHRRTVDYGLGWCALRNDELAEADDFFAKVTMPPADLVGLDALQQRGEIAFRQERFAEARRWFGELVEALGEGSEPQRRERGWYMLGWSSRHLKMSAEAAEAFRRQVELFPQGELAGDGWLRLAEALHERGDAAAAAKVLTEALAQVKPTEELLHLQGDILVALQEWRQVIERSEFLKDEFPESRRIYMATFRMGLAYKALSIHEEAEKQFEATIAATETVEAAQAQFNIGGLYFSQKKYADAGKHFLRVEMLYDYPELSPKALYHATESFLMAEGVESRRAGIYREKLKKDYAASEWAVKVDSLFTAARVEGQE